MRCRSSVIAVVALLCTSMGVRGEEASKYSAWEGFWGRGSPPGAWDPTKPPGPGQDPPLTPQYQAVYESNLAKAKAGIAFDPKYMCGPIGMPRVMAIGGPMELIVKPGVVYMLLESTSPIRRVYTDGRAWPKDIDRSYVGHSIGKWLDNQDDGTHAILEIETRGLKGLRLMENSGIPLADDGETVVKERLYLDRADPDIMHNDISTSDHAFTHPWAVSRFYKRVRDARPQEDNCAEENRLIVIGGRTYFTDPDGYLMPIQKDEPPPDPLLFQKYFGPKK
jgi:hypothetical protein